MSGLPLLDDVRGELRPRAAADVLHRMDRSSRDEQDVAGLARDGRDAHTAKAESASAEETSRAVSRSPCVTRDAVGLGVHRRVCSPSRHPGMTHMLCGFRNSGDHGWVLLGLDAT